MIPSGVAILWTPYFRSMRSHSITKLVFYLFDEKYDFFRKYLESQLIFVFLREKQNKKEKTLNVTLEGKTGLRKTKSGSRGQVTYWEGTVKIVAPF